MKTFLKAGAALVLLLALVPIAAHYFPALTFYRLMWAAKGGDAEALQACIDKAVLLKNLRTQMAHEMNRKWDMHLDPDTPSMSMEMIVGLAASATLTPRGMEEIFDNGGRFPVPALWSKDKAVTDQMPRDKPSYAYKYRDNDHFVVFPADHRANGVLFVFTRESTWSWKLTSIVFPDDPEAS